MSSFRNDTVQSSLKFSSQFGSKFNDLPVGFEIYQFKGRYLEGAQSLSLKLVHYSALLRRSSSCFPGKSLKTLKIMFFPKGLVHFLGERFTFQTYCFDTYEHTNLVSCDIQRPREQGFLPCLFKSLSPSTHEAPTKALEI